MLDLQVALRDITLAHIGKRSAAHRACVDALGRPTTACRPGASRGRQALRSGRQFDAFFDHHALERALEHRACDACQFAQVPVQRRVGGAA